MIEAVQRLKRNAEIIALDDVFEEADRINTYVSADRGVVAARAQHHIDPSDGSGGGFKMLERKPGQTVEELESLAVQQALGLAALMSAKGGIVDLEGRLGGYGEHFGGAKGVIYVPEGTLGSRAMRDAVLSEYVTTQAEKGVLGIGIDRHAPDMNTGPGDMDIMAKTLVAVTGDERQRAAFSGKTLEAGGMEGRDIATGQGLVFTLENHLKVLDKKPEETTVAVQGSGNVGYYFARLAQEQLGVKIVGISDKNRAIIAADKGELRLDETVTFDKGEIAGWDQERVVERKSDDLLQMDADVLVFAAAPDVITEKKGNKHLIKAQIILQGANSPMDNDAIDYLLAQGKSIVSDVQGNAGGFVISNAEYSQGMTGQKWTREMSMHTLRIVMDEAYENVLKEANGDPYNLVDPAYRLAIKNFQRTSSGVLVPVN